MTELQWLIKMLTQQKLPASVKDMFIERIGEVEQSLSKQPMPRTAPPTQAQAPSMQRILEEATHEGIIPSAAIIPQATRTIKPTEVSTGQGLRGPRKF